MARDSRQRPDGPGFVEHDLQQLLVPSWERSDVGVSSRDLVRSDQRW